MHRTISCFALSLLVGGCDPSSPETDAGASARDSGPVDAGASVWDAGPLDAGTTTDAGAPCEGAACAYTPEVESGPQASMRRTLTYDDAAGLERAVHIAVRLPAPADEPAPIVVWSHGGASGRDDPTEIGVGWGDALVRAGYAFVAVAHPSRTGAQYRAICLAVGRDDCEITCATDAECSSDASAICVDGGCRHFKHLSWDRPHDIRTVLDELTRATSGSLAGLVDPTRIVYAGHSAGAGASMMVAGATRDMGVGQTLLIDPRPVAFISTSPQGPGDDGFVEASFTGEACRAAADDPDLCLTRPHLTLTGIGDDTDVVAENRRLSFDLAPETGARYLGWIEDEAARHGTFNFEPGACERYEGADPARCQAHLAWQRSAAIAFLDAHVRGSERAAAYLASDALERLSEGDMSWETR